MRNAALMAHVIPSLTVGVLYGGERVGVGNHAGHLKNCSRGKLPHISLRASAMSAAEIERPRCFQRPRALFNFARGGAPVLKELTKARTSCCFSAGSSRSLATTASSIECKAMRPGYRVLTESTRAEFAFQPVKRTWSSYTVGRGC